MPTTTPLSLKDFFAQMQKSFTPPPTTRTLPNGGGTYVAPAAPGPKPGEYGSPDYISPTVPIKSMFGENAAKTADLAFPAKPIFKGGGTSTGGGAPGPTNTPPALDYSKYINPATGTPYTASEYADAMAKRAGGGVIPNYAGDALGGAPKTAEELLNTARNLNNTRNDQAVGETDPLKIASESGIQYTPAELAAIEKARAGIFDPALNDVMNKLDAKTKADEQLRLAQEKTKQDEINFKQDLQKIVFNTNENIRQWRATTGSKAGSSNSEFTPTQEHSGAAAAGLSLDQFSSLDPDIKNFFISKPTTTDDTGKTVTQLKVFQDLFDSIKSGDTTAAEVSDLITNSATLPEAVKHYFIEQLPLDAPAKQGYFSKIWSAITGR